MFCLWYFGSNEIEKNGNLLPVRFFLLLNVKDIFVPLGKLQQYVLEVKQHASINITYALNEKTLSLAVLGWKAHLPFFSHKDKNKRQKILDVLFQEKFHQY